MWVFEAVFSDEMALEIKEGPTCLPEVEREPPRAKEERHVRVFARVAAKEVIRGDVSEIKVTSTSSK